MNAQNSGRLGRLGLYVYVDGADLEAVARSLSAEIEAFIGGRAWSLPAVWAVNDRLERTPDLGPDDLPLWNLGLNAVLPDAPLTDGRLEDLTTIVRFFGQMHASTGRDFAIGFFDHLTGINEDMDFIDSGSPDASRIIQFVHAIRNERGL